jgi:hypothetical protein
MGLDCVIKYFNGNEYSSDLPEGIAEKFESVNIYGIVGFDINKYETYYYISFRGKAYGDIIKKLTNQSLYQDLELNELNSMYLKLESFLEDFSEIEEVNKAYETTWNLTDWIDRISDFYVPSPNEIIGLKEIFRICYENKLILYASY